MEVKQIATLMNNITNEILGKSDLFQEDLSNVVDAGNEIFDVTSVENYGKVLMDQVGKMIFVNRTYTGKAPSVLRDSWEYGSVLEKIQADIPQATENDTWKLEDGQSYDPNIFYKPSYSAKFYNSKVTFEVPISITDIQLRSAFQSATQLNSFISMLFNAVEKSMTVKLDSLIKRTINNFIAETLKDEFPDGTYTGKTGIKARNLLFEYNTLKGTQLTVSQCLTNSDFLAYASGEMRMMLGYLGELSELFNIEGKQRFTPKNLLHFVMLDKFMSYLDTFLHSNTFHNEFVDLPYAEEISYWQAPKSTTGTYDFSTISTIDVIPTSGGSVTASGIIGVMFDRDALGVSNLARRTTTNYNPRGEFITNWTKIDVSYYNDFSEQMVVFYVA